MSAVAIGIDIGGTKTAAAAVTEDGTVLRATASPTPSADGASAVLDHAGRLAKSVLDATLGDGHDVVGVGVGTAGVVDQDGRISYATATLPGWSGTAVRADMAAAVRRDVAVVNDVHALAIGELVHLGDLDAVVVAVGTGIGGALIRDGRVVFGRTNTAGSIGHLLVSRAEGRVCSCGGVDHLEAFAAGPAIDATYARRAGLDTVPPLVDIASRAERDRLADEVIVDAATLTGLAIASLLAVVDPHVVVLGGGVIDVGPRYLEPLIAAVRNNSLGPTADVEIRTAAFGPLAVAVGAGRHAFSVLAPEYVQPWSP